MTHCIKKYSTFSNGEENLVAVPKERYLFLKKRNRTLSDLEAAGVDNWEGYPFALGDEEEEDDEI